MFTLSMWKARFKQFFCSHRDSVLFVEVVEGVTLGFGGKPTLLIGTFSVCPKCLHGSYEKYFHTNQEECMALYPDYFDDDDLWPVDPETGEPLEVAR